MSEIGGTRVRGRCCSHTELLPLKYFNTINTAPRRPRISRVSIILRLNRCFLISLCRSEVIATAFKFGFEGSEIVFSIFVASHSPRTKSTPMRNAPTRIPWHRKKSPMVIRPRPRERKELLSSGRKTKTTTQGRLAIYHIFEILSTAGVIFFCFHHGIYGVLRVIFG